MIPKQATEKAVEGGWKSYGGSKPLGEVQELIALDATFWQALGKAFGWGKEWGNESNPEIIDYRIEFRSYLMKVPDDSDRTGIEGQIEHQRKVNISALRLEQQLKAMVRNPANFHAFRFYDLILTGGDTEKFWAELLA